MVSRVASRFNQRDATRLLKAAVAAGLKPQGCELASDGTLRVVFGEGRAARPNSFDELMGG